ncbi:MAG: hypothetical protein CMC79_05510 [Flavobacteriaceae bacterium]|nr:hypothetical protein [Flavobacteriaceae bacterium]
MKRYLFILLLLPLLSFSQSIEDKPKKDSLKITINDIESFKNAAGINLDEVIVRDDSLISVLIKRNGKEYIFNPKEYDDLQVDSIRKSLQWQKMGLNEYGIATKAFNLIEGIRRRLTGIQIADPSTGLIRLRVPGSINNAQVIPAFIIDGQVFIIPNRIVQDAIQKGIPLWSYYPPILLDDIIDVQVLSSLAETTKYGLFGSAGVIKITTKNSLNQ